VNRASTSSRYVRFSIQEDLLVGGNLVGGVAHTKHAIDTPVAAGKHAAHLVGITLSGVLYELQAQRLRKNEGT
jgi:hypothetical protein